MSLTSLPPVIAELCCTRLDMAKLVDRRAGGGAMQAVGCILFLVLGLAQIAAGWLGADYYVGSFWATVILILCMFTRFALPITVFGFLGAMHVWGWPWWGALLFSFPGLLIAVPPMLVAVLEGLGATRFGRRG